MINYPIKELKLDEFPPLLKEIPDKPKKLYLRGSLPPAEYKILAVVGSRKESPYGKMAAEKLIMGLCGRKIAIVSGLALGVDKTAHECALKAGLPTIAVPGSGLDDSVIYPRQNLGLAKKILEGGGALVSEFAPDFKATIWSFPQRNRIMAGLSDAVLLVEATLKSGTLITARLAADYNRELLAVPGQIFSENSKGTNFFIKLGAGLVDGSEDILKALGMEVEDKKIQEENLTAEERTVLQILNEPTSRGDLISLSGMETRKIGIILSAMEIRGLITERMGKIMKT